MQKQELSGQYDLLGSDFLITVTARLVAYT